MSVTIKEVKIESCPATRFIGKRYENGSIWGEWWQNDWFSVLEETERLPINGDAYIGAVHIVKIRFLHMKNPLPVNFTDRGFILLCYVLLIT